MDKFPFYSQLDMMDCGPACLRMIAKYYGNSYSLEMLRSHSFISRDGVSMLGISDAAEYLGMHTLGVKITFEQLANEAVLPCILHWNQNHFVVCYGIKRKRFSDDYKIYIADPASQKLCYNKEEFCKCWLSTKVAGKDCGTALLLEPGVNFGQVDDEFKAREKSFTSFIRYLLPYKKLVFQLLLGMVLGSLLQLIFPFLTQAMVDVGIGNRDFNHIFIAARAVVEGNMTLG